MYYAPLHFPVFMFLVVAFVCYMWKSRKKHVNTDLDHMAVPKEKPENVQAVSDTNKGRRSFFLKLYVSEPDALRVTFKHIPGDQVKLAVRDGHFYVVIDGVSILASSESDSEYLANTLRNFGHVDAYIYSRDQGSTPKWMDFLTVIVYY